MARRHAASIAAVIAVIAVSTASAQTSADAPQAVTVDNFVRAETDTYFAGLLRDRDVGELGHNRELTPVSAQTVVRSNRDTLYSNGVFDLDAGPLTITLPDPGARFMSLQVINEDHYVPVPTIYAAGSHTFARDRIGTRYVLLLVRTFIDPNDPTDVAAVHALQDAIRVEQLIGTATGWGGNPAIDAMYQSVTPPRNDGTTVHRLTVRDVPVDAFWSVSVYNDAGFYEPNVQNAYSLNNVTATPDANGSYTIQFGGCGTKVASCLPIVPAWNYTVRMYRPRAAILDGSWSFPLAEPVN